MTKKYHLRQNKCYHQMWLLVHFEATRDLAIVNLLTHNHMSNQISLQSAAVNYSFSDNLTCCQFV